MNADISLPKELEELPPIVVEKQDRWWRKHVHHHLVPLDRHLLAHYIQRACNEDGCSSWGTHTLAGMFGIARQTLLDARHRLEARGYIRVLSRDEKIARGEPPWRAVVQVLDWDWIDEDGDEDQGEKRGLKARTLTPTPTPTRTSAAAPTREAMTPVKEPVLVTVTNRSAAAAAAAEPVEVPVEVQADVQADLKRVGVDPPDIPALVARGGVQRCRDVARNLLARGRLGDGGGLAVHLILKRPCGSLSVPKGSRRVDGSATIQPNMPPAERVRRAIEDNRRNKELIAQQGVGVYQAPR